MAMPDDLTTLICLFHHNEQAEAAYKDLEGLGFTSDSIVTIGGKRPDSHVNSAASLETLGVPERDMEHLAKGIEDGGVLIAVDAFGPQQKQVEDIFHAHEAAKIDDERTDEYTNYKKYKDETQEQPVTFAGGSGSSSSNEQPTMTHSSGLLTNDEDGAAVPVRLVHIYRRTGDIVNPAEATEL